MVDHQSSSLNYLFQPTTKIIQCWSMYFRWLPISELILSKDQELYP